jgi:16S rRNA A1518/A1519 N6-dimethyltransferase RsmA/KsgA/DIM1 with predicted DNA glycosylase/AP lyase activity
MVRHDEPLVPLNLVDLFERLVKQSFHMRRKMLRNNLKSAFPELNNSDILSLLAEAGIQREARPQEVSVESYVKLAELINVKSK